MVDAEPLQRGVAGLAHVLRLAVDAEEAAVLAALVAELRREHDLVAAAGDRAADELLVRERAVHVGRVEEGDPELERAVDRGDRLALVGGAVELGHPHAAEALGGDLQALAAECARLHAALLALTMDRGRPKRALAREVSGISVGACAASSCSCSPPGCSARARPPSRPSRARRARGCTRSAPARTCSATRSATALRVIRDTRGARSGRRRSRESGGGMARRRRRGRRRGRAGAGGRARARRGRRGHLADQRAGGRASTSPTGSRPPAPRSTWRARASCARSTRAATARASSARSTCPATRRSCSCAATARS